MEEQIREVEIKSEERVHEEQKRYKELMARQDRDKILEMESYTFNLHALEKENQELREDILRHKAQVEKLKSEKAQLQDQLSETNYALSSVQEENKRLQELARRERDEATQHHATNLQMIDELNNEIYELRQYKDEMGPIARARTTTALDMPSRYAEVVEQLRRTREENRILKDTNEELQVQLLNTGIMEGQSLLQIGGDSNSLAAEFEAMSKDEIKDALQEQQEVNAKLKTYIDGMLLNILENYPSILEVKGNIRN